jgi:hypothetical protein
LPEDTPHPPVFCKKRLQVIENKGRECRKERKETKRVRKLLIIHDLQAMGRESGLSGAKARVKPEGKSINSIGERI